MKPNLLFSFDSTERKIELYSLISDLTGQAKFYEIHSTPLNKVALPSVVLYEFTNFEDAKTEYINLFTNSLLYE